MRRLIINADDFGLTGGVNRAIVECHRAGSVTSATLMANSAAFTEAAGFAKANPTLGVGCHVMLVDGEPLADKGSVTSLLAPGTQRFRTSAAEFARAAVRRQINPDDVIREVSAQIRKLQDSGITPTHIDTHKHTHMFPAVLEPLLQTAAKLGIDAVRNPFGAVDVATSAPLLQAPRVWLRRMQMKLLSRYSSNFARQVKTANMKTTDGTFGILATGSLDEPTFHAILDAIPDGTWELVCHPGYNDAQLSAIQTRLRESRVVERNILAVPGIRREIERRGIELISFADL